LIIVLVVGLAIIVLPAIIVAVVVWLSGSFFYAGIAFLIVAVVSIAAK
jgi:hypothetical protein